MYATAHWSCLPGDEDTKMVKLFQSFQMEIVHNTELEHQWVQNAYWTWQRTSSAHVRYCSEFSKAIQALFNQWIPMYPIDKKWKVSYIQCSLRKGIVASQSQGIVVSATKLITTKNTILGHLISGT